MQIAHPHLDTLDQIVRIFGWPCLLSVIIWAGKIIQKGQHDFKEMGANAKLAVTVGEEVKTQVGLLQTNHIAHLQQGIDKVAASNDKAVEVLQEISKGLSIVLDRVPRA